MKDIMLASANGTHIPLQPQDTREEIDLPALFGLLSDYKWPVLIGTALFALAAILLYVLAATPVYQATAVLQVEGKTPSVPGQEQPNQSSTVAGSLASTEVPLMTSRRVLGEVVSELGLDIEATPRRFPLVGQMIASGYRAEQGDAVRKGPQIARRVH